jgi:hypothetical protein
MVEAAGSGIPDGNIATNLQLINLSVRVYSFQFIGGQCILVGFDEMRTYLSLAFPWWKSSHHPASLQ